MVLRGRRAAALAAALLLAGASAAAAAGRAARQPEFAYFAFVNDVHNRLEEEEPTTATPCSPASAAAGRCVGGWPRIATEVGALRRQAAKEGAGFFFLDAGDEFTGSTWDTVYRGQTVAPLVQRLVGQDAYQIGNHEFDYGVPALAAYVGNLTAASLAVPQLGANASAGPPVPVLGACNMNFTGERALRDLVKKFVVLRHKQFRVGVLGWITPDTAATAPSVGNVTFQPVQPSVRRCLEEMLAATKGEEPLDLVVGLSHAGYESDLQTAAAVKGIDLIIGGHSHTFLYTPTTGGPIAPLVPGANATNCVTLKVCDLPAGPYPTVPAGSTTPVFQAYYSSKYLGVVKVDLTSRKVVPGSLPLLLGGANSSRPVQPDPEVLGLIGKFIGPVEEFRNTVAGRTLVPLEGSAPVIRTNETNLGNLVCEALLAGVPRELAERASVTICLLVSGGIRSGIDTPGNITVAQVLAMLPYPNTNAILSVSGAMLLQALRNGLSAWPTGGRFLQVSGVRLYHTNGTFVSAELLGADGKAAPINPTANYTITATDYMLQGGDGYNFTGADVLLPSGEPYADLLESLLKRHPEGVSPTTHDRIINCAKAPAFPGCPSAPAPAPGGARQGRRLAQERKRLSSAAGVAGQRRR